MFSQIARACIVAIKILALHADRNNIRYLVGYALTSSLRMGIQIISLAFLFSDATSVRLAIFKIVICHRQVSPNNFIRTNTA